MTSLPATYRSKQGDVVDYICYRQYGATALYTEAVLAANPGLSDYGPILPAGVLITLPPFPAQKPQVQVIQLWS
jgi:phage tail protein X